MQKEIVSSKQGVTMITLFIMGSTLVLGVGSSAREDAWLAVTIGALFAVPIIAVYARILSLHPGKGLYKILDTLFGGLFGRLVALLFMWYAFHLGALVLRNFQEFIKVAAFPETPEFVPVMMMGLVCIWCAKEGAEVLGRSARLIIILLGLIIVGVVALSLKEADFTNLRPFLYDGMKPVFKTAFGVFSFPFAETVLFMTFLGAAPKFRPSRVYFGGLALGGFFVLLVSVRNTLVLGPDLLEQVYFPSYAVVSLINIGDFLQRIEVTVSVVLLFAGFIKISVCMIAACRGVSYIFKLGNYRQIVAPVGLLMMVTSCFIYKSIMEMQDWAFKIYMYYAFPFQVILPVIIWIAAEVKARRAGRASAEAGSAGSPSENGAPQ